jgi:thiol-disulfide isomerase/thioredoxin
MKRAISWLAVVFLLISACDRFEHDTYSNAQLEASFKRFAESLNTAGMDDISGILEWYSPDYLHNTQTIEDMESRYLEFYLEFGEELSLSAAILEYWKTNRITWQLLGIMADSVFVIAEYEDYLIKSGEDYLFYGNQVAPPELDENLPVVLVQYFTATSCGNCPIVAEKLEDMHNEFGDQLVVLEYLYDHDPGQSFMPEVTYYEAYSQPSSIIQGQYIIIGSGESSLTAYESRYHQALAQPLEFRFTQAALSINGNSVTALVSWEEIAGLSADNLQIRAVLLEENPDLHYISAPSVRFENRVICSSDIPYNNSENSTELVLQSSIDLPDVFSVVVWLQNRPENWQTDEAKVFNVIKQVWGE